jgi:hypothetical protein
MSGDTPPVPATSNEPADGDHRETSMPTTTATSRSPMTIRRLVGPFRVPGVPAEVRADVRAAA